MLVGGDYFNHLLSQPGLLIDAGGGRMKKFIRRLIQKHNEKILEKNGFIHCASCKKLILKTDKFCMYCGAIRSKVF